MGTVVGTVVGTLVGTLVGTIWDACNSWVLMFKVWARQGGKDLDGYVVG